MGDSLLYGLHNRYLQLMLTMAVIFVFSTHTSILDHALQKSLSELSEQFCSRDFIILKVMSGPVSGILGTEKSMTFFTVHPQNVSFQNVRFQNVRFQNVQFQNVRFTKRQGYKMSGFKTSGFKTSSF